MCNIIKFVKRNIKTNKTNSDRSQKNKFIENREKTKKRVNRKSLSDTTL